MLNVIQFHNLWKMGEMSDFLEGCGNRRTQPGKEGLSVTLVAAGWMLAYALTSNLCSEATDRPSFPGWVLFVLKLQNETFRVLMNCEMSISERKADFLKKGEEKGSERCRISVKTGLYTFYCLGLRIIEEAIYRLFFIVSRIEIVCRYFAILISAWEV